MIKSKKYGLSKARWNATELDRRTHDITLLPKGSSFFPLPFFPLPFSPLLHFVRCLDVSEVARSVDHSTVTDVKIQCIVQFGELVNILKALRYNVTFSKYFQGRPIIDLIEKI